MTPLVIVASLVLSEPAVAVSVVGQVEVEQSGTTAPLERFAPVPEGATVITHAEARATLRLLDGSELRLGPETRATLGALLFRDPPANRQSRVRLWSGQLWAGVMGLFGTEASFDVETDNAVAGVRGTAFWVIAHTAKTDFVVEEGSLKLDLRGATHSLSGPGAALTIDGAAVGPPVSLDPAAVRALRAEVGGAAAMLRTRFVNAAGRGLPGARAILGLPGPRPGDTDVLAPDTLVDTPLKKHVASELIRGVAELSVKVRLPSD